MPPGRPALTVAPAEYYREPFTAEETAVLERFFTNAPHQNDPGAISFL